MIDTMLFTMLALALAGGYVANKTKTPALYLIVVIALVLAAVGISNTGIYAAPDTLCLNYTSEYSRVWDCNITYRTCSGEPSAGSCSLYDWFQCTDIPGCTWTGSDLGCSGTPTWTCADIGVYDYSGTKCKETPGCSIGWTYDSAATCDNYEVRHRYDYCDALGYTEADNDGLAWTWIFVLMALLFIAVAIIEYLRGNYDGTK